MRWNWTALLVKVSMTSHFLQLRPRGELRWNEEREPKLPKSGKAKMTENSMPTVGSKAPAFDLPAHPAGRYKLSQFKGKQNVVLYFYPRDDTPGCTTEACGFRDEIKPFQSADTVVLGVSTDSVESHQKFATKFALPFPLLADESHEIAEKYGVWVEKNMYGKKSMGIQRATFLIDKAGRIAACWPKVKVEGHVAEVAAKLAELTAN